MYDRSIVLPRRYIDLCCAYILAFSLNFDLFFLHHHNPYTDINIIKSIESSSQLIYSHHKHQVVHRVPKTHHQTTPHIKQDHHKHLIMCYMIVERYAACGCIYHRHGIDPCPSQGRHQPTERTVPVGYMCPSHEAQAGLQSSGYGHYSSGSSSRSSDHRSSGHRSRH